MLRSVKADAQLPRVPALLPRPSARSSARTDGLRACGTRAGTRVPGSACRWAPPSSSPRRSSARHRPGPDALRSRAVRERPARGLPWLSAPDATITLTFDGRPVPAVVGRQRGCGADQGRRAFLADHPAPGASARALLRHRRLLRLPADRRRLGEPARLPGAGGRRHGAVQRSWPDAGQRWPDRERQDAAGSAGRGRRRAGGSRRGDDRGARRLVRRAGRRRRAAGGPVLAPSGAGHRRDEHRGHHDWRTFLRLRSELDALRAAGRIRYLPDTQVWFVEPPRVRAGRTRCGSPPCTMPVRRRSERSPGRRRRAVPRRLRPSAAGSRVGSPGSDGRGRGSGAAQGPRRRPRPPRGGRRHRPVPAPGGDRPRRRRRRGGLHLRGRGAELVAPPSRRHPGCTVQARRGRRVRRRAAAPPHPVPAADRDHPDPRGPRGRGRHHRPGGPAGPAGGRDRAGARRRPRGARLGLHPLARARPGGRCGDPARRRRLPRRLGGRPAAQLPTGRLRGRRGDRGRRGPPGGAGGRARGPDRGRGCGSAAGPHDARTGCGERSAGAVPSPGRCIVPTPCRPAGRSGSTTTRRSAAARR